MKFWLITVNFGDTRSTESLLKSLDFCNNEDSIRIAIADNSSTKDSKKKLSYLQKNSNYIVDLFPFKENLFYWPAAKAVIKSLKGKLKEYPDWILICNNDITFCDKNFFNELRIKNPKINPIIGPDIINTKGSHLNPFMVNPLGFFKKLYWLLFFLSYPTSRLILILKRVFHLFKLKSISNDSFSSKNVYAVHGSAILFSSHFFNSGGWLDDSFEMYGEELSVAEIAKKNGFTITYCPSIKLKHNEHETTRKIDQRLLYKKARKSHKYIKSNYLGK